MPITKYLNPRNDIAFKKIFGTEKNKDILIHFLNDVIEREDKKEITNVTLLNGTVEMQKINANLMHTTLNCILVASKN